MHRTLLIGSRGRRVVNQESEDGWCTVSEGLESSNVMRTRVRAVLHILVLVATVPNAILQDRCKFGPKQFSSWCNGFSFKIFQDFNS